MEAQVLSFTVQVTQTRFTQGNTRNSYQLYSISAIPLHSSLLSLLSHISPLPLSIFLLIQSEYYASSLPIAPITKIC